MMEHDIEKSQPLQNPLGAVPRRKPVATIAAQVATSRAAAATTTATAGAPHDTGDLSHTSQAYSKTTPKWVALSGVTVFGKRIQLPFANDGRKRLLLLSGIVAIILIALIIGLAVGLTVGRK